MVSDAAGALPNPPQNLDKPLVFGIAPGETITCGRGSWSDQPTAFTFEWTRDGAPIAGANQQAYGPTPADDGTELACRVTATNAGGSTSASGLAGKQADFLSANETALVSRPEGFSGVADDPSYRPAVSADGRFVVFESLAKNLSPDDLDATPDIFLRDTLTGQVTLVSRRSNEEGGEAADGDSFDASISADGRYVAFDSKAPNLSAADDDTDEPGREHEVFVRDVLTGTTTLVSRQSAAEGGVGGNSQSLDPAISADGRFVAFQSRATNLSTASGRHLTDIYVRDLETATTTLVSVPGLSAPAGLGEFASAPSISGNGRYVAFASDAENLSAEDAVHDYSDVYVRDVVTGTTELASRRSDAAGGAPGDWDSRRPSISSDGRFVAFMSSAPSLYEGVGTAPFHSQIYVRDMVLRENTLASRSSATDGNGVAGSSADYPSLSGDGSRVAFLSNATELSPSDSGGTWDVFVRDLEPELTTLATRASGPVGVAANDSSIHAELSANGRYAVFDSLATNLTVEHAPDERDIYIRGLHAPGVIPPANLEPPTVSGDPRPGNQLTCAGGTWSDAPTSFEHSWSRNGVPVLLEATEHYLVREEDLGSQLACSVTARNDAGDGEASSGPVTVLPHPPANITAPEISGTAVRGATLTCSTGEWLNDPTGFAFEWRRDSSPVSGADGEGYVVAAEDVGGTLTCTVTATNDGGSSFATTEPVVVTGPAITGPTDPEGPSTPAPPAGRTPELTIMRAKLARVLRRGLVVRISGGTPGRLRLVARDHGRKVAAGAGTVAANGNGRVRLRFARGARQRLRSVKRLRLKVSGPGISAVVTLRR